MIVNAPVAFFTTLCYIIEETGNKTDFCVV